MDSSIKSMTPEAFTEELKSVLGDRLVSVVLYGSAAAGEHSADYSDYNLLVVCSQLRLHELDLIRPLARRWAEFNNPPPLLFTWDRLLRSSDVFPIELLDIKENHLMIHGEDILRRLPISQANLRYQVEHELKGKLIQLRESYLLTDDSSDEETLELMIRTVSTFQVLLRASLRFFEIKVPRRKRDAAKALAKHVSFDLSVFDRIQTCREGRSEDCLENVSDTFQRYLDAIEKTADLIEGLGSR